MSTTAPEYLTALRDGFTEAVQQWMDQSTTAWDQWTQAWSPAVAAVGLRLPGAPETAAGQRSSHGHHHGEKDCGCGYSAGDCREHGPHHGTRHGHRDDVEERGHPRAGGCHDASCCGDGCDCCVPEADVVVRARAGEMRVVPFRLHNPWRREREVSLEVGPWHRCSGDDLEVRAVLEETKVVLGPCEDRVVRLLVSTRGSRDEGSPSDQATGQAVKAAAAGKPAKPAEAPERESMDVAVGALWRRTTDVETCASAYADVRFEGCGRPQRVAVVVLPADCDAVEVGCDCGCCC